VALSGRVTGPEGQPVTGAQIIGGLGSNRYLGIHVTRTDAQGRYELTDLAPYDAEEARKARDELALRLRATQAGGGATVTIADGNTVTVAHPDFAVRQVVVEKIPAELDVQLALGAVIEGRIVLDPPGEEADRQPAVGADVGLVRDVPPAAAADAFRSYASYYSVRVHTDADGRYSVRSLPAGKYNVSVVLDGWTTLGGAAEATAGQTTQAPDVVMTRGGTVRLQLVDESGKPIAFAEPTRAYVNPVRTPEMPLGQFPLLPNVVTFSTNAVGEFHLPPGDYAFVVHIPAQKPATDPSLQSTNIETIRTEPTHAVVEGETIEINVPIKRQPPPTGATATISLAPAAAIPAAPPAEQDADNDDDNTEPPKDDLPSPSDADGAATPAAPTEATGAWTLVPASAIPAAPPPVPDADNDNQGSTSSTSPAEQLVRQWRDLVLAGKLDEADELVDPVRKEYAHDVREERYLRDLKFAAKYLRTNAAVLVSTPAKDADGREGAVVFRVFRNVRPDRGPPWYLRDADFVLPDELKVQIESFTARPVVDKVVEHALALHHAVDLDSGRVMHLAPDFDNATDDPLKYISLRGLDAMCASGLEKRLALAVLGRIEPVDAALWEKRDAKSVTAALEDVSFSTHQLTVENELKELPATYAIETSHLPTGEWQRGLLQVLAADERAQTIQIRYWLAPATE
jgi:hypothetical protein